MVPFDLLLVLCIILIAAGHNKTKPAVFPRRVETFPVHAMPVQAARDASKMLSIVAASVASKSASDWPCDRPSVSAREGGDHPGIGAEQLVGLIAGIAARQRNDAHDRGSSTSGL
jgi:hypothetical protein